VGARSWGDRTDEWQRWDRKNFPIASHYSQTSLNVALCCDLDSWFLNRKDGVTMYSKQSLYSRLSNGEKYEDNGSETHGSSYAPQLSKSQRRGPRQFIELNASILLISIITFAVSIILRRSKSDYSSDMNALLKKTSFYCEPLLIQMACQN
jgi:hypothetical protein